MHAEAVDVWMQRWRGIVTFLVAILIVQIPFELRYTLLGLSNLQWTFVALALAGLPLLIETRNRLASDRLVKAAALLVATQWVAAIAAQEFHTNAYKAAIRFSAGFVLFVIVRSLEDRDRIYRIWGIAAAAAAAYALAAYAGLSAAWLFRGEEFYIGQVRRLSGSFEYPNTAAIYYGMSLAILSLSPFRAAWKWAFTFLVWCALILTFSKGALAAVSLAMLARGWRPALKILGTGAAAYALLLPVNPYMYERLHGLTENPIAAEYKTPWNQIRLQPAAQDRIPLQMRNVGITKWRAGGLRRSRVSYRWLSIETDKFVETPMLITALPRDVGPGESVEVQAAFETPSSPGKYILAVELFSGDFDWFSRTGVKPAVAEVDVEPSNVRTVGVTDLSIWYHRGANTVRLTASVPRLSLWRVALRMFWEHPFGVGPDNYRLEYGRYLGAQEWDTNVHSNNLYLELLTGSGVLGLASFGLLLASVRWRAEAACLAIAVFMAHGFVDVFLTATPIYFAFWISLAKTGKS